MKRRLIITSLILVSLLAASCGSQGETPVTTNPDTSADTTAEETTSRLEPELPDKRWDGYEFRVLTRGTTNVHWKSKDIAANEENGDIINDAIYKRNLAVSDRFGVKFVDIPATVNAWNISADLRPSILSGSDDYDMATGSVNDMLRNLAPEGLLTDLTTVPYMDLTKPWYDQKSIDQLSIGGKAFAVTGDLLIMDDEATLAILFNKKMVEDYKLPDLYELVNSGKWTIDKMNEFAAEVADDLDSDGKMGAKDQYGLISEDINTYALMIGSGTSATKRGDSGKFEFNVKSEKFYDAFTKAVKLNCDYDITMFASKFYDQASKDVWGEILDPTFSDGRALFNMAGLVRVTHFRAMEIDFGIIPTPKYDEAQENYYSMVSTGCSNSITIPSTATDLERTGAIIEALSAEGYYNVKSAYYDNVLKTKSARDEESGKMLDIIFENRIYDPEYTYAWGGLLNATVIAPLSKDANITSAIETKLSAAQTALDKTYEDYAKLK